MIIALAWIAFLLYWVISAARIKPIAKSRNWVWTSAMIASILCLYLLLRLGIVPKNLNAVLWPGTIAVHVTADVLVLFGLLVFIWARWTLGANWSANVAIKKDHELVQSGAYRYVRHPIYTGFLTMMLGTAAAYGRLLGIIILAVCIGGFSLKAMQEESLLTEHFPDAYPAYKLKTKAFIPYIL